MKKRLILFGSKRFCTDLAEKGLVLLMVFLFLSGSWVSVAVADVKGIRVQPKATVTPVSDSETKDSKVLRGLIIGINRFQDSKIRELEYCRADAISLKALLTDRRYAPFHSVEVKTLLDDEATREKVRACLEELGNRSSPMDTVVIYFSSHGIQQEQGNAYWVLNDSRVDQKAYKIRQLRLMPASALERSEISGLLSRIRSKRLLVIIDSCFSAATVISYPRGKNFRAPEVRNPLDGFEGEGRVFITASEGSQEATELPDLGHGAFTYFLLEGLKGKADSNQDNVVELWEIWQFLENKVTEAARRVGNEQRPTISSVHLTHGFPLTTYPLVGNAKTGKPYAPEWVNVITENGKTFCISSTEITNRQYLNFTRDNPEWRKDRIRTTYQDGDYLKHWPDPDQYPKGLGDHPVTYVSWFAAKAFSEWVGGRLPSGAEWMIAAAGRKELASRVETFSARLYPWGNQWYPALCNHRGSLNPETAPVNAFEKGASLWRPGAIYNMAGNAWEWCDDWVFEYRAPSGTKEPAAEPIGADKKPVLNRLIKGGSYLADRIGCMIPSRLWADPRLCAEDGGFRVVKD